MSSMGTDYPFEMIRTRQRSAATMSAGSDDATAKIVGGNAKRLLGF